MPHFSASFQQPSLDTEVSKRCLGSICHVIRAHGFRCRVRTASLGTSVPSSPIVVLHHVMASCFSDQLLNPKTRSRSTFVFWRHPCVGERTVARATLPRAGGQSGGPPRRRGPCGGAVPPRWGWRECSTSPSVAFLLQTTPGAVSLAAGAAVTRSEDPHAPSTTPVPVRRVSSRKSLGWTPSGTRDKSRHKPPTPWRKKKPDTRAIGSSKET